MADYTGQANAIYDPQLQADTATLNADKATTEVSFTDDTNAANEAYNQALKTLGDTEATGEARNNFNAATHGLASSGLIANGNRLTYGKYQEGVATTAQVRADKLASVAGRKQAAEQGYADKQGALASKYSGLKSQYISEHQNADAAAAAKFQQQQELAAERNAAANARAASKPPTATEVKSALLQDINQYLDKSKSISKPGYAESVALPDLYSAYNRYGLSDADINSLYYSTRSAKGLH